MTDPAPTAYGPTNPYATLADLSECGSGCDAFTFDPDNPATGDGPLLVAALGWASRRVFLASGQRFFGLTESTIRPCRARVSGLVPFSVFPFGFPWETWPWPEIPYGWDSGIMPVWACNCSLDQACQCTTWDRIPLPLLPVRAITEVKIDGAVFNASHYCVYQQGWLLRTDGDPWPSCQAVEKPDTEADTWSVTYQHGLDLPPEAVPLVGMYACELATRCKGGDCQLPAGVRVAHRDGVDFVVAEPSEYRKLGQTGFPPVDDWVALLNGGHVQEAPRIYRAGRSSNQTTLGH